METAKFVWMDAHLVPWDDANIHVMSHGLHYGAGVFEGLRCYETARGPAIFRLGDHIRRLERSAKVYTVGLPFPVEQLAEACREVVRANGLNECYIRPIVYVGFGDPNPFLAPIHAAVGCWPWDDYLGPEAYENGVTVKISSFRKVGPNAIPPAAKATGQYLNSILAKVEALTCGYDECILLDDAGYVAEGSSENVFIVRDRILVTPPASAGALPGVTRDTVMALAARLGYEVREEVFVRSDLYLADEAFFTGTASEIVSICGVDGRPVGTGEPGPVVGALRSAYCDLVHGRIDELAHWLDPIDA